MALAMVAMSLLLFLSFCLILAVFAFAGYGLRPVRFMGEEILHGCRPDHARRTESQQHRHRLVQTVQ